MSCSCPQGILHCTPLAPAASVTTVQPPWYQNTLGLSLAYPMHSVPIEKNKNKATIKQLCQQSAQFLLWENLPTGNAIIWAKHCDSKPSQTRLCALHLHHEACGVSRVIVPLKRAQGVPSIMLSPHLGARPQRRTSIIPQSLSASPRLLALFILAGLWHWLLSFPQ